MVCCWCCWLVEVRNKGIAAIRLAQQMSIFLAEKPTKNNKRNRNEIIQVNRSAINFKRKPKVVYAFGTLSLSRSLSLSQFRNFKRKQPQKREKRNKNYNRPFAFRSAAAGPMRFVCVNTHKSVLVILFYFFVVVVVGFHLCEITKTQCITFFEYGNRRYVALSTHFIGLWESFVCVAVQLFIV